MIELDGSFGEGGGQILRTALSLSLCTGSPFVIDRIRAGRQKPGLLRQHLTAVQAAQAIGSAGVEGATLGSQRLEFRPAALRGGDYRFAIGTAGSCTLVLQTLLPALLRADGPSTVTISGGTHNPAAPPADFLQQAFLPLLGRMGVETSLEVLAHGFFPAGGGELRLRITPTPTLSPLHLPERGATGETRAESWISGVPGHVAERELATVRQRLGLTEVQCAVRTPERRQGPGNVLLVFVPSAAVCEVFSGFGEHGVSAERVANGVCREVQAYLASGASVGEHLADQLLLPMALAGGGSFTAATISSHCRTNMAVIERFLPVKFRVSEGDGWQRVEVAG